MQVVATSTAELVQIDAGYNHTCGVDTGGLLHCWGSDFYGQSTPPAGSFSQVSSGVHHTCAVDSSGALQCWGVSGGIYDFDQVSNVPISG